jgi:hypothetical protein
MHRAGLEPPDQAFFLAHKPLKDTTFVNAFTGRVTIFPARGAAVTFIFQLMGGRLSRFAERHQFANLATSPRAFLEQHAFPIALRGQRKWLQVTDNVLKFF